jgi:hypothetical protein
MALLWDRFDLGHLRWLRGKEISLGPVRAHTTSLISGLMFILLGVAFIIYEGTSALEGLYDANGATDVAFAAQQWAGNLADSVPTLPLVLVLALLLGAFLLYKHFRRGEKHLSKQRGYGESVD